mmetsp:Transcript_2518/g.6475  ORF Transcript_2518/g.6475 Transcript_2518/m.6475 type:complete len:338 (+) Transcript_2518:82-1095(+)|eukprot:CAMPEP_0197427268 /NCGR_PEP_ID=MMETSP1170-20131217/37782_1 /TAXON_ID=54406 /ORGANISM="Sarcinochrysis sp, Strain CCMP770" /LENGTH=337 /DNA_ID=CAMNT_0042954953 /DNA_START=82 /DNA_END=1095 /DNA_ORIENTATION=+
MKLSDERKGVAIATIGVVCVTPDAVLMRWATATGGKLAAVVFWKVLFMSVVVMVYAAWSGKGRAFATARRHPLTSVGLGCLQAISIITLSYSFVLTFAANAVLCFSMHPLWSAICGLWWLEDRLPRRTVFALVGALVALVVMFFPELQSGAFSGGRNTLGDILAITASITMALFLTGARAVSRTIPDMSVPLCSALGLIVCAAVIGLAAPFLGTDMLPSMRPATYAAVAIGAVSVGIINIAFSIAPSYITASEVGIIGLIEAVFSPVWVFAIYGEVPPRFSIIGGGLLLVILAAHALTHDNAAPQVTSKPAVLGTDEEAASCDDDGVGKAAVSLPDV